MPHDFSPPQPDLPPRPDSGERPVMLQVRLCDHPLELDPLWEVIAEEDAGAHLVFVGRTRRRTGQRVTRTLVYEAFTPMAEAELLRLLQEAAECHGLTAAVILHRLGEVAVGAASIAVAVSSPHRRSSFAAVASIMDMVKTRVPIWKQEAFEDGSQEWVHPPEQAP